MGWLRVFKDNVAVSFEWRLKGFELIDRQEQFVAPVLELLYDEESGEVRYVTARLGGLLSIEGKGLLLPVDIIIKGGSGTLVVDAPLEHIGDTPSVENLENPGREEEELVFRHYGVKPYWVGVVKAEEKPKDEKSKTDSGVSNDSAASEEKDVK